MVHSLARGRQAQYSHDATSVYPPALFYSLSEYRDHSQWRLTSVGYEPIGHNGVVPPTHQSPLSSTTMNAQPTAHRICPAWLVPPRILLVDDDAIIRNLTQPMVKEFGCGVDVAVDGLAAVKKTNLMKYDLILMDILMPKLDGVTTTRMIRQFDTTTPIISVTSANKPQDASNYFSHGMNDILPKPFHKRALYGILEKHLQHLIMDGQSSQPTYEHVSPSAYRNTITPLPSTSALRTGHFPGARQARDMGQRYAPYPSSLSEHSRLIGNRNNLQLPSISNLFETLHSPETVPSRHLRGHLEEHRDCGTAQEQVRRGFPSENGLLARGLPEPRLFPAATYHLENPHPTASPNSVTLVTVNPHVPSVVLPLLRVHPSPNGSRALTLEAAVTVDLLQDWLDHNYEHPLRPLGIQRLIHFYSNHDRQLPMLLFITGVRIGKDATPVAGGSFADVLKGTYQGREVAVKRFRAFLTSKETEKLYKRFYREALIWRQLRHPNILSFLGVDQDALRANGSMCMISPWMAQGTLMEYLRGADYMTVIDHKRLILDIAAGLYYLHRQPLDFVHGDLHGSNVFINECNRALLGDFGLTAMADYAHLAPTTTINKAGAIRWLCPELILQDEGPPPRKTQSGDIFAFGRICLSVFTRLIPFHNIHADARVLLEVVEHRHPRKPRKDECYGVELPDKLWDLVSDCWVADAATRPDIGHILEVVNRIEF